MRIDLRLLSSLEKVFPDEPPRGGYRSASALLGEVFSLQAAWSCSEGGFRDYVSMSVNCDTASVRARRVRNVPVGLATFPDADSDYLKKTPGLYPDMLEDSDNEHLRAYFGYWESMWIDIEGFSAGEHTITVTMKDISGTIVAEESFRLHAVNACLPKQELIHTKWFHCDCLCDYYGIDMWSEEFWTACEKFLLVAVKRGINMLLTPIHTPPLDTREGTYRMKCQLVDISVSNDKYAFSFDRLERWVEMAKRLGFEYFEMAHLFTQWGAKHAPAIYAHTAKGEERIFGWETDATGLEYVNFLNQYIPALVQELNNLGIADRCYFHISDEPSIDMLNDYISARDIVADLLKGFTVMDALSSIEFYKSGAVSTPIPANNHIQPFIDMGVKGLWSYYCVGQYKRVANMFIAMPSYRNRIYGYQLYKYDIAGILQWGYNFYSSQYSDYPINPFSVTDGDGFVPAGDPFQVYPGKNYAPIESIRMMVTYETLADLRAMKLLESLTSKEHVMSIIEHGIKPITFDDYPRNADYILDTRELINREIEKIIEA